MGKEGREVGASLSLIFQGASRERRGKECRRSQHGGSRPPPGAPSIWDGHSARMEMEMRFPRKESTTLRRRKGTPRVLIQAMKLLLEGEKKYTKFQGCVDEVAQQIEMLHAS